MVFSTTPVIPPVIPQVKNNPAEPTKAIPPVITTKYKGYAREPNEIISPWFEEGVFAGVRVKTDERRRFEKVEKRRGWAGYI